MERKCRAPKLGSYVDDIFGGFEHDRSLAKALDFRRYLCDTGALLTLVFDLKLTKTALPARKQVILGCLYNSVERRVRTAANKQEKYLGRIRQMLEAERPSFTNILKLHGNLNYAAGVSPFGRPFLAALTNSVRGLKETDTVIITEMLKWSLRI